MEIPEKQDDNMCTMGWTHEGAHYLLQTRTAVLNDELHGHFERWHPGLKIEKKAERLEPTMKMAA